MAELAASGRIRRLAAFALQNQNIRKSPERPNERNEIKKGFKGQIVKNVKNQGLRFYPEQKAK